MEWIFSKSSLPDKSIQVGNKAYNLFRVLDDVNIPAFVVLDSSEMLRVLSFECNKDINEKLRVFWTNKLSIAEKIDTIKSYIMDISFPNEYMNKLRTVLGECGVKVPYSVRSSSVYEDNKKGSAPGVFESYLNVADCDLEMSIKKCWASNFSERTLFYFGNEFQMFDDIKMGIIIQNMRLGEYAGILFSVNPVTGDDEYVLEVTERCSEALTDGTATGVRIILDPMERCIKKGDDLPENLVIALTEMANTLKQKWGCHVDIEWCYCQGKVYLIQVRPVSVIASKKTKKISSNRIYSISEIDNVDCEGAGLEPRIRRWKGKKQHFNRCCDSLGIKHLEWFFVENYQDNLQTEVENRLQKFSGKFVTLAINETLLDVVKNKEEVIPFMQQYGQLEDKTVISFRDVPMNNISVISTYNGEESVYIEVIDGIMKGLKTGELQASVYEVDYSGNIIASREYHEKKKYVIEFPSGDTFMVENENNSFSKYEDKFVDIAIATKRLYENGQVGAIEWWICDNEVFAADISISSVSTSLYKDGNVSLISNGDIEGFAYFIDDDIMQGMNELSFGTAISVDKIDESALNNQYVKMVQRRILREKNKGKIVLVLDRPYLGIAPLLSDVDGIVFGEASLLCHLSVMLREKKIPAIAIGSERVKAISPGEFIVYKE